MSLIYILLVGFINGFWIGWLVCFFNRKERIEI